MFRHPIAIDQSDIDHMGHVNNAVYLNYFEEARDLVMVDLFGPEALDFVLAHVDIDFRSESPRTTICTRAPALARCITAWPAELPAPITTTSWPPHEIASERPAP